MLEIAHLMSPDGPKPVAPFSHAVRAGDFLFVTGQMPTVGADNTQVLAGAIEEQTHQVIKNLQTVLASFDSALERAVHVRIYLVNFGDYERMNAVYRTYFDPDKMPARTCIGVTGLAVGALVEVDLIAAC
ncbi:MAG: RidA family protein [Rhizobiaceae bacterium]